jgi:hypothetical protein
MGRYLGSWKLDDIIRVHIQTSAVTTGAATDADAAPTWRIYEDDTATPVTTGSFSTLNSQVGFYVAAVTLAASIGYEKGKTYAVRTQATVGGVIGADVHSFQIEAEVDANTNSGAVVLAAGAITAGTITDGALTSPKFAAGFITAGSFSGNALAGMAVTLGSTTRATLVDEIWDEPKSGHTTADTYGEYLDGTITGISGVAVVSVGATAAAAIADAVWSETAANYTTAGSMGFVLQDAQSLNAIVAAVAAAVTANSIGAVTVGSTAAAAIAAGVTVATVGATAAAAIADAVWDEAGSGHVAAGSFGARLNVTVNSMTAGAIGPVTVGSTAAAAIAAAVSNVVTVGATAQAAIADAVWDEPKAGHTTADTYGEYLDATASAIRAKTDLLFAGTGNSIAADIKFVNGVSVTGNGQSGTEWGPGS